MNGQPFHLKATKDDIVAATDRDDYQWLVDNVFIPALAQFMREKHAAALVKGSSLPRSRRQAGTRHHRIRRSHRFRPRAG
jgi:hypothetical protein